MTLEVVREGSVRESADVASVAREALVATRKLERAMLLERLEGDESPLTRFSYGAISSIVRLLAMYLEEAD